MNRLCSCPVCGRTVPAAPDGSVTVHADTREDAPTAGLCPGAGMDPVDATPQGA